MSAALTLSQIQEALKGLDTLIIDALRYTPHPSHAHLELTLFWIAALKPRRAILSRFSDFEAALVEERLAWE